LNLNRCYARAVFWPTWGWNLFLGRVLKTRHWWDEVDPAVILSARPLARDVPELAALGVTHVVNTCEEFGGHRDRYEAAGIVQLHLPITDFQPPAIDDIEQAVDFMDRVVAAGGKVLVHCKAGRARSATIVLCWLMKRYGWTAEMAQAHLSACRSHVNRHLAERAVVREFAGKVGSAGPSGG
jgi:atypical dual specificity phosphatase